jgi:hypothetical protein
VNCDGRDGLKRFAVLLFLLLLAPAQSSPAPGACDEFLLVPVRVHLLSAKEKPRLTTTLTSLDVQRILNQANGIWAHAGIHFYLESLVKDRVLNPSLHDEKRALTEFDWLPELCPPETRGERMFNLYFLKEFSVNGYHLPQGIFVKDEAVLTKVPGGFAEPIPRVTAHELGHGLGLVHRQNVTNLMASSTTGTSLSEAEIKLARATAVGLPWIESASAIRQRADELSAAGRKKEAKIWHDRLAKLPVQNDHRAH